VTEATCEATFKQVQRGQTTKCVDFNLNEVCADGAQPFKRRKIWPPGR
jgi:hypothetical protein